MNEEEQDLPPQEAASASVGPNPFEGAAAPEISRRVGSILDAVEREAARLREEARVEATSYFDDARRRADGLVAERQRRIGELSDELIAKSEAVIARLDDAAPVRMGFENLVRALGDAAERLANEADGSAPDFNAPPFGATPPAQPYATPPAQPYATPPAQPYATPPAQPYATPPAQPYATPATDPGAAAYAPRQAGPGVEQQRDPYAQPTSPYYPDPPPGAPGPAHEQYGEEPPTAQPLVGQPTHSHPARTPSTPDWQAGGVDQGAQAGPAPAPADPNWREHDEARMMAIQMAATGATRGSVREQLHRALGLRDTAAVLDEVFGPGSGEEAQVPWTSGRR